jgi:hypothetical protein
MRKDKLIIISKNTPKPCKQIVECVEKTTTSSSVPLLIEQQQQNQQIVSNASCSSEFMQNRNYSNSASQNCVDYNQINNHCYSHEHQDLEFPVNHVKKVESYIYYC